MVVEQAFNVENRLTAMTRTGNVTLTQVYDADGVRVKKRDGYTTTIYIGNAIEIAISGTNRVTTTYYFFGGARVAMRQGGSVTWLHGDHLGSASLATSYLGAKVTGSPARYTPFGEYRAGLAGTGNASDNRFTGQKRLSGWNLDDFNARMFSAVLGRFVTADTIVPGAGNPQNLNRFSALGNNPLKYVDPSGHAQQCWNASKSQYQVCPASGNVAKFERWFTTQLVKTRLGKELLAKKPAILQLVLWGFWSSNSASSQPVSSLNGDKYYLITIHQGIFDTVASGGSPSASETALVAHEVFHVYQRETDTSRAKVFTTKQMEREAYAFQYGVEYDLNGATRQARDSRRAPWLGTANSAYQQLLDDARPKSLSDLGRLPTYLQYSSAPDGTRYGGDLNAALTIDLGFSSQAIQSIYDSAGVPMPPPPTRSSGPI